MPAISLQKNSRLRENACSWAGNHIQLHIGTITSQANLSVIHPPVGKYVGINAQRPLRAFIYLTIWRTGRDSNTCSGRAIQRDVFRYAYKNAYRLCPQTLWRWYTLQWIVFVKKVRHRKKVTLVTWQRKSSCKGFAMRVTATIEKVTFR